MKSSKMIAMLLLAAVASVPAFAKKDKTKDKPDATATPAPAATLTSDDARPAALVAGKPITMDELDRAAANQLMRIRQQEFQVRSDILQGLIQQKLVTDEAAARNVSEADLLKTEVDDKTPAPTQDEISQYYERMKARMGGKTLDEVKGDIEKTLKAQKANERRAQFIGELSTKSDVKIMLDPPRATVSLPANVPALGPSDAPVTIVEWSDYQCPFCKRAHPVVEQILTEYKDKVRFIYLDYPLPFHKQAMPASLAVHCAEDQGKFWEYHRNLFEIAGDLSDSDLSKRATDLGLDNTAFTACIESKKHEGLINSNYKGGADLGVTGTPAFFINGRMLVGAQPIDQFRQIINDELSRKGVAVAKSATTAGTN